MLARRILAGAGLLLLLSMIIPFAYYSGRFGLRGLFLDLSAETRFDISGAAVTNTAIFAHMLLGGVLTLLVPLQAIGGLRDRAPRLHRVMGKVLVVAALVTAAGGVIFILARGTIGGWWMSVAFAIYGLWLALTAVQLIRAARAGDVVQHRRWALRFVVLALGSWIYRVHYGLWFTFAGGIGVQEDLHGPFDRIQVYAFFVPYMIALEMYLRRRPKPREADYGRLSRA